MLCAIQPDLKLADDLLDWQAVVVARLRFHAAMIAQRWGRQPATPTVGFPGVWKATYYGLPA